jgi:hypothetical protein
MCEPVTITAGMMWAMGAAGAVVAGAAAYSAKKTGEAQAKALGAANQTQADQISKAAGAKMMDNSREARRNAGEARASASEAGINLGSGSFLAVMQNSLFNESFDNGLVSYNEDGQQDARQSEYSSRLASINIPTTLGIGLSMANGAMAGYNMGAQAQASGVNAATRP